jgi:sulfur transfer protein SufE/stress-induced morphogen
MVALLAIVLVVPLLGVNGFQACWLQPSPPTQLRYSTEDAATSTDISSSTAKNPHRLPPELLKIANAFEAIGDDKLRYKQLLFMAGQTSPMDPSSCIPENKVPGCLSTVYVDGTVQPDGDHPGRTIIQFKGDSDGLLTKGLVALLVRGLSGNTAADIQQVDPAFIQTTGIGASLTPGRNNGFLNMLAVMKRKALELEASANDKAREGEGKADESASSIDGEDDIEQGGGPIYKSMVKVLRKELQPTVLELSDVSHQHAGHVEGGGAESHFELGIVSSSFEGLNLVKRHKLIYQTLGEIMPQIHALQIQAQAPSEYRR